MEPQVDLWEHRPGERRRRRRSPLFRPLARPGVPPFAAKKAVRPATEILRAIGYRPIAETPGEDYLAGRGIPADLVRRSGIYYAPRWDGYEAVIFPLLDDVGSLVAYQGRIFTTKRYLCYLDEAEDFYSCPKAKTYNIDGTLGAGYGTFATPGAWEADPIIICEAPIDALSLASCGFPAIATVGCGMRPPWVRRACAFRHVLVATDADDKGDEAALLWARELRSFGARVDRLRPHDGREEWSKSKFRPCRVDKDWNDALLRVGIERLKKALVEVIRG